MNAAERSSDVAGANGQGAQPADMPRLQARRREARRRRHLVRVDLGLGVVAALVLLLATPGLAISGLVALIVLLICALTFAWQRREDRRRRHREDQSPR
jgi:Flp pilus assembly protein TadB